MATTTLIPLHAGKGRSVAKALGISINYVENPNKTDGGEWVSAYECDPLIADDEFLFSKNQYAAITGRDYGKRDVRWPIISGRALSRMRLTLPLRTGLAMSLR